MPENFDEKYLKMEADYQEKAIALHKKNERIQAGIRQDLGATPEEREERYMKAYESLNEEFEKLANTHALAVTEDRRELEKTVNAGTGERFSEHLTALANVPDGKLEEMMKTARRTGQKDLARAIAHTALDRNRFGVFEEWAAANPETADALTRLRSIPDLDRLRTRTLALRPFKASPQSLTPTQEDRERVANAETSKEASKAAFFNRPRRQVGSRRV